MAGQYTQLPVQASTAPVGGATAANQVLEIAQLTNIDTNTTSIDTKTPALGQAVAAASVPVVLTAAQISTLTPLSTVTVNQGTQGVAAWPVLAAQSGTWNVNNVSGTVSLPTGASTSSLQTTGNTSVASIDTKTPALGQALAAASVPVVLTAAQLTTLTPVTSVTVSGTVTANAGTNLNTSLLALETGGNLASINTKTPALGQALAASAVPVVLTAIQQAALTPLTYTTATSTLSNVASSATTVTVLASNASRKGAMITNDSTASLYLKFGATASVTSYTVLLAPGAYYEMPANPYLYTGILDGIWSAANGNARVTELS